MKKLTLFALFSVLFVSLAFSQGDPKKAYKMAVKGLNAYNLDQQTKYDKLLEAKKLIDFASEDATYGAMAKVWNAKGQIYNAIAGAPTVQQIINPNFKSEFPNAAMGAYAAFNKGLELAQKKFEKTDAMKGLNETIQYLTNMGLDAYDKGDFVKAYDVFSSGLSIADLLKSNGVKSILDSKEQYQNQQYITALAASNSKMFDQAGPLFEQLINSSFEKPAVYDGLYKVKLAQNDEAGADAILAQGREKYPDDQSLLYSEINNYLKKGKMDELVGKLETAIAKDPSNKTLHSTLGSVYDNLFVESYKAKEMDKASNYFDKAKASYEKALEVDPEYFEAMYSVGALYYNKAAEMVPELNALSEDLSKAGMKKYDAKKAEMDGIFEVALPLFLKAVKIRPADIGVLTALKEIYARKNDKANVQMYSERLEAAKSKEGKF